MSDGLFDLEEVPTVDVQGRRREREVSVASESAFAMWVDRVAEVNAAIAQR